MPDNMVAHTGPLTSKSNVGRTRRRTTNLSGGGTWICSFLRMNANVGVDDCGRHWENGDPRRSWKNVNDGVHNEEYLPPKRQQGLCQKVSFEVTGTLTPTSASLPRPD